jgi:hypothetical protein
MTNQPDTQVPCKTRQSQPSIRPIRNISRHADFVNVAIELLAANIAAGRTTIVLAAVLRVAQRRSSSTSYQNRAR